MGSFNIGFTDVGGKEYSSTPHYRTNLVNIRNTRGKLYAHIVLLFNENPHFVNLIQENSIPLKAMQKEGFHLVLKFG